MGQGEEETKQKRHFTFCQEPGGEGKKRKEKEPQPFVSLAWQAGCLGTGAQPSLAGRDCGSAILLHCDAAQALAGSAPAPSTTLGPAVSLKRLRRSHPRCLHKCFLTNVDSLRSNIHEDGCRGAHCSFPVLPSALLRQPLPLPHPSSVPGLG